MDCSHCMHAYGDNTTSRCGKQTILVANKGGGSTNRKANEEEDEGRRQQEGPGVAPGWNQSTGE
eukprot:6103792-Heterocapsa_arctica.AAC.1